MTGLMYGMGLASVAVMAIPLAFVAWRVARVPLRAWLPLVFFLSVILLIQGCDALGGGELLTALIFVLAGGGRP